MTFDRSDDVQVQSRPGFPGAPPEADTDKAFADSPRRGRILVADGYKFVLLAVAETLRDVGYDVLEANTISAALACLDDCACDAAIMDWSLEAPALAVAERLASLRLPFVFLTADKLPSSADWAVHDTVPILRKPATAEQIADAIARMLE